MPSNGGGPRIEKSWESGTAWPERPTCERCGDVFMEREPMVLRVVHKTRKAPRTPAIGMQQGGEPIALRTSRGHVRCEYKPDGTPRESWWKRESHGGLWNPKLDDAPRLSCLGCGRDLIHRPPGDGGDRPKPEPYCSEHCREVAIESGADQRRAAYDQTCHRCEKAFAADEPMVMVVIEVPGYDPAGHIRPGATWSDMKVPTKTVRGHVDCYYDEDGDLTTSWRSIGQNSIDRLSFAEHRRCLACRREMIVPLARPTDEEFCSEPCRAAVPRDEGA